MECWGENDSGQLGDDTNTSRSTPARVNGLPAATKAMGPGGMHMCVLLETGDIYCWGNAASCALGDGTKTSKRTATKVEGLPKMISVSGGWNHTCAVAESGEVYCWGFNGSGQVGDGTTTDQCRPTRVRASGPE